MKLVKLVKFALTPPIVAFIVALAATLGARAELLVYEGFSMNDYTDIAADGKGGVTSRPQATADSVGTSADHWYGMSSAQVFVYGADFGLGYDSAEGCGQTSVGGSVGLNPDSDNSAMRASYHELATDVLKVSSGKLYVSMLLNADSIALAKLTKATVPKSYHYGFGVCVKPTADSQWTLLATQPSALSFMIWNNNGTYKLSLFVTDSGKSGSQVDICTVAAGTTYLCYAEIDVGAGTSGKEKIKAGAVAMDENFNFTYDWTDPIESELITAASYPTAMAVAGPYGTKTGCFRADELRIGTMQTDVLPVASGIIVKGYPANCGAPDPGYGEKQDVTVGQSYTFNPPADGEADGVKWHCTGWEFVTKSGVKTTGTGAATITYTELGTLTWLFTRQFKVEFACTGGSFDTNTLWYAEGEEVTVVFTPDAGRAFCKWAGDVAAASERVNPLVFTADGPKAIEAVLVGDLPSSYTPLEYIESAGTQYINTGLKAASTSVGVEIRYQLPTSPSASVGVFGASKSPLLCFVQNVSSANAGYNKWNQACTSTVRPDLDVHTLTVKSRTFSIDGASVKGPFGSDAWSASSLELYLFACNEGSVKYRGNLRIYSCKFTNVKDANGASVNAEFVPCRDPSGKIGLYETIGGTFFGNAATTGADFTAGPVEDILVTGSPAECGTPDPGYGWVKDELVPGTEYTFNPPADGESGGVKWQCTGWKFVTKSGVETHGTGAAKITYTEPGTLTWLFDRQFKVEFTCTGGDVNTNKLWYAEGETAAVTFTPDAERTFFKWGGDVSVWANPLVFTVDGPKAITGFAGGLFEVGAGKAYADIATAIAAAENYDTVLVYDGTYEITTPIHVEKPITVRSVNGAAVTTVKNTNTTKTDEGEAHRVFFVNHAEALVEGFTISGGVNGSNLSSGGGQRSTDEKVTSADYGAGVRIGANGGTLANCVISGNTSYRVGNGAGFAIVSDDGVISNCVIRSNSSSGHKGCGSIGYISKGLLTHCTITNNTANGGSYPYGGLYMTGGRVSHCVFQDNNATQAGFLGTAIYQPSGTITVDHTVISDSVSKAGGTVYLAGTGALLDNCLIAGNRSVSAGAGVSMDKGTLLNCTIIDNVSTNSGAGVHCRTTAGILRNCLIQGNRLTGAAATTTNVNAATEASYTYCLCPEALPGGVASGNVQATVTLNSRSVPRAGSAAVDKGSVTGYEDYLVGGTDLLGKPRVFRKVVDIGCCENQSGGMLLMVR